MTTQTISTLERLLRTCELGWMIDWHDPPDEAVPMLLRALEEATSEAQRRFGNEAPTLSEDALDAEFVANSHRVRAFLQALGATRSPQMLVMVWQILQGATITSVELNYRTQSQFMLRIVLPKPLDGSDDIYETEDINDAAMLRHFGIATIDGAPLFEGFYPLQIK